MLHFRIDAQSIGARFGQQPGALTAFGDVHLAGDPIADHPEHHAAILEQRHVHRVERQARREIVRTAHGIDQPVPLDAFGNRRLALLAHEGDPRRLLLERALDRLLRQQVGARDEVERPLGPHVLGARALDDDVQANPHRRDGGAGSPDAESSWSIGVQHPSVGILERERPTERLVVRLGDHLDAALQPQLVRTVDVVDLEVQLGAERRARPPGGA